MTEKYVSTSGFATFERTLLSIDAVDWGQLGKFRPKDPTAMEACLLGAMFAAAVCPSGLVQWDMAGYVRKHALERHFEKDPA